MVTSIDLLYVALFALAWPLFDYVFFWPRFLRRVHAAPAQSRAWLWRTSIVTQWWLVAIGVALWMYFARPWSALKLAIPEGWRLAVAVLLAVAFSAYQVYCISLLPSTYGAWAGPYRACLQASAKRKFFLGA